MTEELSSVHNSLHEQSLVSEFTPTFILDREVPDQFQQIFLGAVSKR